MGRSLKQKSRDWFMVDAWRLDWPFRNIITSLMCVLMLNLSPYLAATQCNGPASTPLHAPHTHVCGTGNILPLRLVAMSEVLTHPKASILIPSAHQPSTTEWKPTWREECCSVEGLLYPGQQTQIWRKQSTFSENSHHNKEMRTDMNEPHRPGVQTTGSGIRLAGA